MFQLQLAATVFVVESWLSTGTRTRLVSVNRVYLRPVKKPGTGNLRVIRLLSSLDTVNVFVRINREKVWLGNTWYFLSMGHQQGVQKGLVGLGMACVHNGIKT